MFLFFFFFFGDNYNNHVASDLLDSGRTNTVTNTVQYLNVKSD
jgi:hypothetical protein